MTWGSAGPPVGSAVVTVWAVTSVIKDQSAGSRDTGTEYGRRTSCDVLKYLRNEVLSGAGLGCVHVVTHEGDMSISIFLTWKETK